MQSITPVTTDQLLEREQSPPLVKFEIYYCCCWVDLTSYLKKGSLSVRTAGAEMTPNPVAGSWSVTIFNKNGRFDPDEPGYAPYNEYFKVGRKVKISVGARYDDVDYYWRRIYGFMELPKFSIGKKGGSDVSLSGFDNMQFLTDTKLKEPTNYWGTLGIFDSVATTQYGAELYDVPAGDAAEIGGGEANSVANWAVKTNGATAISSQAQIGGFSNWEIEFIANPGGARSVVWYQGVCAVVAGTEYYVTFKYARTAGDDKLRFTLYDGTKPIGGTDFLDPAVNGVFETASFSFTAEANEAAVDLWLVCRVPGAPSTWRIDNISIKSVTSKVIYKYEMPDECMGIHYVELDEGAGFVPVWPGRQKDGEEGWFYDTVLNQFYFAEGKIVDAGTANLKIHYYTQQAPENVVADLLARAGLYNNQAEALAAMLYTATSVLIDKVWFKAGSTCLNAVKMLCERCNYRFYFNYGQRPVFKPTPTPKVPGLEDFSFLESHITNIRDYEDRNEIRNRIIIEGIEQALPEGAEETKPSKFKGETSEVASINKYGEHTMSINNHLFQDQATVDAYCAIYLAAFKDPKWYTTYDTPFNPAPLEKGDTVTWRKKYEAGGTPIDQRGIIRDIQINDNTVTYTIEKVA